MGSYLASVSPMEASLVGRIQSREEGAFRDLFHQFQDRIFRTALKILKDEESVRDAVQDTLVNIHRAAGQFRGDSRLSTWINRITVNVCLEMLRKNRKHRQVLDEDISEQKSLPDPRGLDPYRFARQAETAARVHRALACLPRKQRDVVWMHDLEGYTIREIAEHLQVAEGTIKSRLFYGREELKKQLKRLSIS